MKQLIKTVSLSLALVAGSFSTAALAAEKIAVVFPAEIFQQLPQKDQLIEKLKKEFQPRINEMKSLEKNIPIIPEEKGQIEIGALATEGIDFYKLGYETGLMAADVLDGKSKPEDMPVKILEDREIYVNKDTLEKMKLIIPESLKDKVELLDTKSE